MTNNKQKQTKVVTRIACLRSREKKYDRAKTGRAFVDYVCNDLELLIKVPYTQLTEKKRTTLTYLFHLAQSRRLSKFSRPRQN